LDLLIRNTRIYSDGQESLGDLRIRHGRIVERSTGLTPRSRERVLDLSGYLALPGLINSHDHFGLNLFPHMGEPPYPNFYAWAEDIYHPGESPIRDVLRVSLADRLWWSAYKSLISGVTTVVHHDPYYRKVFNRNFPTRILKKYGWTHSLAFGKNILEAFKKSRGKPFIIHAAEGTDGKSSKEIEELDRMRVLGVNTVIVHGIAIGDQQIQKLSKMGVSVVWCPASNQFLYRKNAPVRQMKGNLRMAIGTDSTLSGSPTLLEELRVAKSTGMAMPEELLEMVTTSAASIFHLPDGAGTLEEGAPADLFLLPDSGKSAVEALLNATPAEVALVTVDGEPRLANEDVSEKFGLKELNVMVENVPKWICGNVAELKSRIQQVVGLDILSKNPLWSLIEAIR
jgi:cytosine/adenosine deaminase-related metal-dependent hydrolase